MNFLFHFWRGKGGCFFFKSKLVETFVPSLLEHSSPFISLPIFGIVGYVIRVLVLHSDKCTIKTTRFSSNCVPCCLGKSSKLSFIEVKRYFNRPLYLVYSDLWQSPISFTSGTAIVFYFLMISLDIHGCILCERNLMPLCYSVSKIGLKFLFNAKITIFKVMVEKKMIMVLFLVTWLQMVFTFANLPHTQ